MSSEFREPDGARAEALAPALDRDILDALTVLIKRAEGIAHTIAGGLGVTPSDLLAMFKLDGGIAMKDLAQRLGCDASFITAIADNLEKRGFMRREPSQRDRRVKNLVFTPEGEAAKEQLMAQLAAMMPWCYALDDAERRCFLGLLRKMIDVPRPADVVAGTEVCTTEVCTGEAVWLPHDGSAGPAQQGRLSNPRSRPEGSGRQVR
jgi:DNA-binding MarR family transcriptional regulator